MRIEDNLNTILTRIRDAEKKAHRDVLSVSLLAVSKKQSAQAIREAYLAGQKAFGENYLQEALSKQQQLSDLPIEWHFIGSIQSNKTKQIAQHFDWVHSVDRLSIADQLNRHRAKNPVPLNVCIEVNIENEQTKSGVPKQAVLSLAKHINSLTHLTLRGLMIIPSVNASASVFEETAFLQKTLISQGIFLDTLSMGMSSDFETAIAAGSTLVRIGTALFGNRI